MIHANTIKPSWKQKSLIEKSKVLRNTKPAISYKMNKIML